jgi:hypothetical protein
LDGPKLVHLLLLYRDTTFMLEKLIKGLRAKREAGDWDRSLQAKEPPPEYSAEDADIPFTSPDDLSQT